MTPKIIILPRAARRTKLRSTWYFDCLCPLCGDAASERGKHSAQCGDPACGGMVTVEVGGAGTGDR